MSQIIRIITILLLSGIGFSSCRSIQYVPIETVRIEYKSRDSIRYDSIYDRDSVYMLVKGDTIYQFKYKYLYKYRTITKTDTVIKNDTVQIPHQVEKQLTRWQTMKQELGGWVFGVVIAIILFFVGRLIYRPGKE